MRAGISLVRKLLKSLTIRLTDGEDLGRNGYSINSLLTKLRSGDSCHLGSRENFSAKDRAM